MPQHAKILLSLFVALLGAASRAETNAARAEAFINFHTAPMARYGASVTGTLTTFGGSGLASLGSTKFRFGGGGAMGFLLLPSSNVNFGLGYGGLALEYAITDWFTIRGMIGMGGIAISNSGGSIAAGGFIFIHPIFAGEFPLTNGLKMAITLGYFIATEAQLAAPTGGFRFIF